MKKAALHNLGCKVNAYETEAMQEMLESAGYEIVPFKEGADIYIINTCTVTNIADRKSRQMLHRARRMNPDAIVVAAGCYVQAQGEGQEIDPCIDIVIGNNMKQNLVSVLKEYESRQGQTKKQKEYQGVRDCEGIGQGKGDGDKVCVNMMEMEHAREYESLSLSKTAEHTRAYIKVQDGCNQFCSYCIIPFARGRVRSRALEDVEEEVKRLASQGCQEVVLTGIHLSSYGMDWGKSEHLLSLLATVHKTEGIRRIRLGSLEPRIITEEFVKNIVQMPKLCAHFHLSLQSGCDATLKRMNRRYSSKEYYNKCVLLRKYFANPAVTTDIIVGFPGETQEEFEQSRAFVEKVNFYETHIFKYSKRQGTKAASMEGQITEQEKARRSDILLALNERHRRDYEKNFIGKEVEVLFEEQIKSKDRIIQAGHTREYMKIALECEENLQNCIVNVEIENDLQFIH